MDDLKQEITLFHKTKTGYKKYSLIAFVKATSIENLDKTGVSTTDKVQIRIFDKDNEKFEVDLDDIVVNKKITTEIQINDAPLTELQKVYGKRNVYKVINKDEFKYADTDVAELNHIKLGLV